MSLPDPLSVEVVITANEARLVVRGEIDIETEQALRDAAASATSSVAGGCVIVDLQQVSFIDSSGLRALLQSRDAAQAAGTTFRIAVTDGAVLRLFKLAGVSDWFEYE